MTDKEKLNAIKEEIEQLRAFDWSLYEKHSNAYIHGGTRKDFETSGNYYMMTAQLDDLLTFIQNLESEELFK